MREPDHRDADLVLKLYDLRRETEMRKARSFMMNYEVNTLADVKAIVDYAHPENAHFRQVTSYWGMVADFATRGILHPEMFAAHCGEALWMFTKFEPLLPQIRAEINPAFMTLIETAIKSHPSIQAKADQIRAMRARMAAAATQAPKKPARATKKAAAPAKRKGR